ncbi:MAG: hypothetical protein QM723_10610 [Myxococcaceae bacterium]
MLVAVDKTAEAPVIVGIPTSPALDCQQIEIDGDTLLCLDIGAGSWLHTIRAAQVVSSVPARAFGYADGQVWVETPQEDNLYLYGIETDGSLSSRAVLPLNGPGQPQLQALQLLVNGDRALLVDDAEFIEVQALSDGGFDTSAAVSKGSGTWAHWVPGAGVVTMSPVAICHFASGPSGYVDAGCIDGNFTEAGYDDDGVWWTDAVAGGFSSSMTLSVEGVRSGQSMVATASLGLLPIDALSSNYGQQGATVSPMLHIGTGLMTMNTDPLYLPEFDGSVVNLVRYPLLDEAAVHADSKRIWAQRGDSITWYPR